MKRMAKERVNALLGQAKGVISKDKALANRYALLARRIAMAAKISIPAEYRTLICRHCKSFIFPGVNSRVRIQPRRKPHLVITCLGCGELVRIPLEKESRKRKL